MKQIKIIIDPRSGKVTELKAEGYSGGECAKDTERIRKALGMTGEVTPTHEMYVQEEQQQKLEAT